MNTTSKPQRLPTYFISHGGGPWPWMDDFRASLKGLEASLADMPRQIGVTPKAVLVISGHWEEAAYTVMASPKPPMLYDYGGFPAHTYQIRYDAPGSPELALRVKALIEAAGLPAASDAARGYDHGTFVPLYVMYPHADVPVMQLSMRTNYDPLEHVALGRALGALRDEGVLIVGSGLSYHNLRRLGPAAHAPSAAFDAWLQQTLLQSTSPAERIERLAHWADAPAARVAHPREDHLIPLMVALGAAEHEAAECVYHEVAGFTGTVSSFRFGAVG
jgi:aromatic ring-opening dioxygenase catalytic subunit (LigB family)